ncbi:MAG TPA: hypothetical protein VKG80_03885 [Trebonia sp.]|nr:hypothetical protein [Trebonia sp.]
MAEKKTMDVYAASYDTVEAALAALSSIEQLHKDAMIGSFDAAVIGKENGKPRIVKRMDRPRVRVIPEELGGGTLPRKELKQAAAELTANEAGLIAVGEPTIAKGISEALETADKVVTASVDASVDEITSELREALKS